MSALSKKRTHCCHEQALREQAILELRLSALKTKTGAQLLDGGKVEKEKPTPWDSVYKCSGTKNLCLTVILEFLHVESLHAFRFLQKIILLLHCKLDHTPTFAVCTSLWSPDSPR